MAWLAVVFIFFLVIRPWCRFGKTSRINGIPTSLAWLSTRRGERALSRLEKKKKRS